MLLMLGDCLDLLRTLPDASVDAVVTDPPYELGFLGKHWDSSGIAHNVAMWAEALRVLKPGGYMLAFGGTRTHHRMTCAIEDAGFTIRDEICWLYGSGFPKSLNIGAAIDKAAGAEREVVGKNPNARPNSGRTGGIMGEARGAVFNTELTAPATDLARQWDGWGTALKPGHEPIVVAQKPLQGTYAANVARWGVGGLNIDGCRIGTEERTYAMSGAPGGNGQRLIGGDGRDVDNARRYAKESKTKPPTTVAGRWPANVILDEDAGAELDAQSGVSTSSQRKGYHQNAGSYFGGGATNPNNTYGDTGGASRFFLNVDVTLEAMPTNSAPGAVDSPARFLYCAKASRAERRAGLPNDMEANHPTVKPLALMRWLVRLVTPPGGTCLDPFAGSGTTGVACVQEGRDFIGIERDEGYVRISQQRIGEAIARARQER